MSEPKPLDFVYAGRRPGSKYALVDCVYPIEDGKLRDALYFKADRSSKVMGGVYTGALFSENEVRGLSTARYTGQQWGKEHPEQVMEWEAKDSSARHAQRAKTLENDAKSGGLIAEAMSELAVLYAAMRRRGDFEGMAGLEAAVLKALRRGGSK